jgi:cell wall-associated NlpC family hydrolase
MRVAPWILAAVALGLAACAAHQPREPAAARAPAATGSLVRPLGAEADAHGTAAFVAAALAMVGQPYRWGGTEPGGFDCSGLIVYAARRAGLELPRTAREQAQSGGPVARKDVQAGDLVFLHLARKELHVGIALDAGHFVHSPSSGGTVRVDSLALRPYVNAFLQARRLRFPR